jgi:hypothetical protein
MCKVFRQIYTKIYNPSFHFTSSGCCRKHGLAGNGVSTIIFDMMTYLPYHLVQEQDICGPVTTWWMYLVEKCMKTLKAYVRNMARSEVSMAEGYLKDKCIGFVTKYLQRFNVLQQQMWDAEEFGDAKVVLKGANRSNVMMPALET